MFSTQNPMSLYQNPALLPAHKQTDGNALLKKTKLAHLLPLLSAILPLKSQTTLCNAGPPHSFSEAAF